MSACPGPGPYPVPAVPRCCARARAAREVLDTAGQRWFQGPGPSRLCCQTLLLAVPLFVLEGTHSPCLYASIPTALQRVPCHGRHHHNKASLYPELQVARGVFASYNAKVLRDSSARAIAALAGPLECFTRRVHHCMLNAARIQCFHAPPNAHHVAHTWRRAHRPTQALRLDSFAQSSSYASSQWQLLVSATILPHHPKRRPSMLRLFPPLLAGMHPSV